MDDEMEVTGCALWEEVELHENCTVQILRNVMTGELSVGWWKNEEEEHGD